MAMNTVPSRLYVARAIGLLAFGAACLSAQPAAQRSGPAPYYVVFLRPHPARQTLSKEDGEHMQRNHMANIRKMADAGVLVSAGPFDDQVRTISGIFVLKAGSLEQAQQMAAEDPTVVAHRNTVDAHAWVDRKSTRLNSSHIPLS